MDKIVIVFVLAGCGLNALAGTYYWHGVNGDGVSWEDELNWSAGVAPEASDGARVGNAAWIGYPVTISTTTSVYDLYVGVTSADPTLAELTITADSDFTTTRSDNYIGVSIGHSSNGKITSAGTVNLGAGTTVLGNGGNGNGELYITGGSWTTRWLIFGNTSVATNHVQLDGGTFTITGGGITGLNLMNQTMDITAGTLVLGGDETGPVSWWAGLGNLTGYGDPTNIVAEYDSGNDVTTVVAMGGEAPWERYVTWMAGYGLVNTNGSAAMDADPDNDRFDNLAEYALGGNPTNNLNQGYVSELYMAEENGTNWMVYVHYERADKADRGLTYVPEVSSDLIQTNWSGAVFELAGSGAASADFNAVSN